MRRTRDVRYRFGEAMLRGQLGHRMTKIGRIGVDEQDDVRRIALGMFQELMEDVEQCARRMLVFLEDLECSFRVNFSNYRLNRGHGIPLVVGECC